MNSLTSYTSTYTNLSLNLLKAKENEFMVCLLVTENICNQIVYWFKNKYLSTWTRDDIPLTIKIESNSFGGLFNVYYIIHISYGTLHFKFRFYIISMLEANETWPTVLNSYLNLKQKLFEIQEENIQREFKNNKKGQIHKKINNLLHNQTVPYPFNLQNENYIDVFLLITKEVLNNEILGLPYQDLVRIFMSRGIYLDQFKN